MAIEKKWEQIPPVAFSSNGTSDGIIALLTTRGFRTKQKVNLKSNTQDTILLEVKRVISKTQLLVGPLNQNLETVTDISAFLTADNATIDAPEQPRPSIPLQEHERAVFEEEPVVAKRTVLVDQFGRMFDVDNPVPVQLTDGSINIGTVNAEIEVQLSHKDNYPDPGDVNDSVRIGDGTDELQINPDGSINTGTYDRIFGLLVNANWLKLGNYDHVIPSFSGNIATLDYYEDSALIAKAQITFVNSNDWDLLLEAYMNEDDGSILEDDDDTPLLMD